GKRALAEAIAREAKKKLLVVDLSLPAAAEPGALDLAFRDARFLDAMLYLDGLESPARLAAPIASFPGIVFAGGTSSWVEQGRNDSQMLPIDLARPDYQTRRELWQRAL